MDAFSEDRRVQVGRALDLLLEALGPFVERETGVNKLGLDERLAEFVVNDPELKEKRFREWDVGPLLNLTNFAWLTVFRHAIEPTSQRIARSYLVELQTYRYYWVKRKPFSEDDKNRALDTTIRFLHAIGANDQAEEVAYRAKAERTPELIDALDEDGQTPLHLAVRSKNLAVVEVLKKLTDLKALDEHGQTPLHGAVRSNNPDVVEALIEAGADPNALDEDGQTPLHLAAPRNNLAVVKPVLEALMAASADPNARDEDGRTPLHGAVRGNNPDVVKALIEAGADSKVCDRDGITLLHVAALRNSPEVVKTLLKEKADLKARNKDGDTPLHCAARLSPTGAIVMALIEGGSDLEARDKDGKTPVALAKDNEALLHTLQGRSAYHRLKALSRWSEEEEYVEAPPE